LFNSVVLINIQGTHRQTKGIIYYYTFGWDVVILCLIIRFHI